MKKIAKDRKVIPDPIDDRKFQDRKESEKCKSISRLKIRQKKRKKMS